MSAYTDGTKVTLQASGTSSAIVNNAIGQAITADLNNGTNDSGYPFLRFTITFQYSVAPTVLTALALYRQVLNMDGIAANDAPSPSTTYLNEFVGNFLIAADTNADALTLDGVLRNSDNTASERYWVLNNGTGQTLPAGWALYVTPYKLA